MSFQNRVYVTSAGSLEILWPQKMTNPLINSGVRCSLLHKICSPVDRNPSSFSCPELPQIPMPISIQVRPDIVGTLTAEGEVSLHLHSIIFFRWQKTGDFGSFGLWRCCLLILIGIKMVYMQAYLQRYVFSVKLGLLVFWSMDCSPSSEERNWAVIYILEGGLAIRKAPMPTLKHLKIPSLCYLDEPTSLLRTNRKKPKNVGCVAKVESWVVVSISSQHSLNFHGLQIRSVQDLMCIILNPTEVSQSRTALCWHRLLGIWRPERASYLVEGESHDPPQ